MAHEWKNDVEYREINLREFWNTPIREFFKDPRVWTGIKVALLIVVLLILLFKSFYVVKPDEEGVIRRFGRYIGSAASGIHLKIPFIDTVVTPKVTEIKKAEFGFRTGRAGVTTYYAQEEIAEESEMLTADKNIVSLRFIVQYKIRDARKYLFNVRNQTKTIRDASEAAMRQVVGDRGIDDALTVGRMAIQDEVKEKLQQILDSYEAGIYISTVKLQDVTPPGRVKDAWDDVNRALQKKSETINRAREEYNKVVPKAEGEAAQMVLQAEAYAIEKVNKARGEADKFTQVLAEYQQAKEITKRRLYLETLESILQNFDQKYIIDEKAAGGLLKLLEIGGKSVAPGGR